MAPWALAGPCVAGCRRPGDQLLRRMAMTIRGVAGGRGRRAGHPADARPGRRAARSRSLGRHDKPLLVTGVCCSLLLLFACAGRLARPRLVGAGRRVRRAGGGRRRRGAAAARRRRRRRAAGRGRVRDLAGLPVAADRAAARAELASRRPPRPDRGSRRRRGAPPGRGFVRRRRRDAGVVGVLGRRRGSARRRARRGAGGCCGSRG